MDASAVLVQVKVLFSIKLDNHVVFVEKELIKRSVKNQLSTNFFLLKSQMDTLSIEDLVHLGKKKEQKAYHELFRRFWKPIYHFLLKRTNDEHDAELLSIEVFTKAFDKLSSFNLNYQFENWLFTIAKNHHIDHTRKVGKQQDLHTDITSQQLFNVPSEVPTIEDDLIQKEKLALVLSHLDKLKEDQRALMEAFYIDDHSLKQVSEKFNLPINTVKVKIFRSRKRLLQLLKNVAD